jgi:hypothetical protein
MGYREHDCVGCKEAHGASVWYYRRVVDTGGREYLCGEEFNALTLEDKLGWLALESPVPGAGT